MCDSFSSFMRPLAEGDEREGRGREDTDNSEDAGVSGRDRTV